MKFAKILSLVLVSILCMAMFAACETSSTTTVTDADGNKKTTTTVNGETTVTEGTDDDAAEPTEPADAEGGDNSAKIAEMAEKFNELAATYDNGMEAVAASGNNDLIEAYKGMGDNLKGMKEKIAEADASVPESDIDKVIEMIDALLVQVNEALEKVE